MGRIDPETAEECGTAYYRYGAALFYRAQEEQDVFGDDMRSAAQERDTKVCPHSKVMLPMSFKLTI